MRLVSIASGSSGNCIYVGTENTHILVDAGISNKRMEQGLNDIGLKGSEMDGILITHEHSDHIRGIAVFAKKNQVPLYGTRETLEEVLRSCKLSEYPEELVRPICPDVDFAVGDMSLQAFSIDHDAANPVAYRIRCEKKSVAVATDMGHYDQYIIDHLKDLDALLLESNHDVRMLETGPYPYYLKRRIMSDHGHLSNDSAGQLLNCVLHDNMKQILLGHLSQTNNYAELAYETVRQEIDQGDHGYRGKDFSITVARRDAMSEIVSL